jgi:hypothetical protein
MVVPGLLARKFLRLPGPKGFIQLTLVDVNVASKPVVGNEMGLGATVPPSQGASVPVTTQERPM